MGIIIQTIIVFIKRYHSKKIRQVKSFDSTYVIRWCGQQDPVPLAFTFHLLILANNLTHSDFTLLAIADGVANSRFIGCLVALFFLQVLITVYNATSHT